ncbi:MAG: GDP-L-fucose synthase [Kosmotoga sp.]|nr:MAG: GDP-L-fucose synthase [Kosmotoga sp.]
MNREVTIIDLKNKRIAITGGNGFLGKQLSKKLKEERGCKHILIPELPEYDLTKESDIKRMYEEMKPDIVIHLAAVVGGIGANRALPGKFFYDNAIMGIQLIEYARRYNIEKFVQIGTICAYPKYTPVPFKEENLWDGYPEETNAPYGLAKKILLVQLQAYRQEYGLNGIFLLPVNLYGPGDNFDLETSHVIPAMIRKFAEAKEQGKEEVVLWGDGSPTREFLYVKDAAEGIIQATEKYDKPDPINLGAGFEISIKDLANKIKELVGYKGKITWDTTKPNGQPRRMLDTTKAKEEFGFEVMIDFENGLKKMIKHFLSRFNKN